MDAQRSFEAAGAGSVPLSLLHRSSTARGRAIAGQSAEEGLLASFDAIFRQTLAPQPAPSPAPPPKSTPAPLGDSGGDRQRAPETGRTDASGDDDREAVETTTAATLPSASSPAGVAADPEGENASDASTAPVAGAEQPEAQPAKNPAEKPANNPAAEAESAEAQVTEPEVLVEAPQEPESAPSDASAETTPQADAVVAAPAEILTASGEPVPTPEAGAIPAETASPAAAAAAPVQPGGEPTASAELASQPAPAAGEPATRGTDVAVDGPVTTSASDEVLTAAGSEERHAGTGDRDASADREGSGREPDSRGERAEERTRASGSGAGRGSDAGGGRTLDALVSQMQSVDGASEAAPLPAQAPVNGPAENPVQATASPAVAAAAGPKTTAADAPASAENRFTADGIESRRSVGGVKAEAGDTRAQNTSAADRVRLVQRVARAFQRLGPAGGRVQVMLHPAALGSVRLDLRIDGNRMDARMTAETEAARSVLREHLPELRQRLAEAGLVVERVEIDIDSRSPDSQTSGDRAEQGNDRSAWRRGDTPSASRPRSPSLAPAIAGPDVRPRVPHTAAGLDLMA